MADITNLHSAPVARMSTCIGTAASQVIGPISTVVATLVLASGALFAPANAQRGPAAVGVADVETREISDTRSVIGQLTAATEARVATRTAGIIAKVLFVVGDDVSKGATLVQLDTARLAIEKSTAEAAVSVARAGRLVAEADLRRAEQAFERQAALRNSRAFSRGRYEDLEQDAAKARAELRRANAEIQRAETTIADINYRLKHAEVKAPFDGVVIAREAQPGAYMSVGSPIATLLDASNLEVEADVPVELIGGLRPGSKVAMRFDGGGTATATVRAVIPVQSIATRTRPVRFIADMSSLNAEQVARGKSVTLDLPVGAPRQALTVPKDALVQAGRGWQVFAVRDGKAVPTRIEIGSAAGDRVIVISGIEAGAKVVIRGNERLRPGQAVRIAPSDQSQVKGRADKQQRAQTKS